MLMTKLQKSRINISSSRKGRVKKRENLSSKDFIANFTTI